MLHGIVCPRVWTMTPKDAYLFSHGNFPLGGPRRSDVPGSPKSQEIRDPRRSSFRRPKAQILGYLFTEFEVPGNLSQEIPSPDVPGNFHRIFGVSEKILTVCTWRALSRRSGG